MFFSPLLEIIDVNIEGGFREDSGGEKKKEEGEEEKRSKKAWKRKRV